MEDQQTWASGASDPVLSHWTRRVGAAILSLFVPGLGQAFAGRFRRGVVFLLAMLGAVLLVKASAWLSPRWSSASLALALIVFAGIVLLATALFAAIDAWRVAQWRRIPRPIWFKRWGIYGAFILCGFLADPLLTTGLHWRAFSAASASMLPTLQLGDRFYVLTAYFSEHEPRRGDLVVFHLPCDYSLLDKRVAAQFHQHCDPSIEFIKRIIGLPGDRVQLRNGIVYVNETPLPHQSVGAFRYTEAGEAPTEYSEFEETTPEGARYHVLLSPRGEKDLDNTDLYTVPPGGYFVLGDNRDDSADSRDPTSGVGFVPRAALVGRAALIYFSRDSRSIRWDRIGMPLS